MSRPLFSVRFSDRPYVLSHMTAPRGRGSWAFSFEDLGAEPWFAPGGLTLSEAKRAAADEARRRAAVVAAPPGSVLYVEVLP